MKTRHIITILCLFYVYMKTCIPSAIHKLKSPLLLKKWRRDHIWNQVLTLMIQRYKGLGEIRLYNDDLKGRCFLASSEMLQYKTPLKDYCYISNIPTKSQHFPLLNQKPKIKLLSFQPNLCQIQSNHLLCLFIVKLKLKTQLVLYLKQFDQIHNWFQ